MAYSLAFLLLPSVCRLIIFCFVISNIQRIDGFLAVLNVTGGNFSPKSQKLPFSVNSVDGDNYLLYYSSIDLNGHLLSNNSKSPKMRRSLSIDDPQADRSRLRIPMKGRIQLVIYSSRFLSDQIKTQVLILFSF